MTVPESYQFCERVARREAKNFYYSFLLLPRGRRRAMCAVYAFMRYCDDLSDSGNAAGRASAIAAWKADLEAALGGETPAHAVWPAFKDTVARYRIPHQYFFDMIEGVSSDLEPRRFETFEQLYGYCYRVASVVGLTIIHIFGFQSPAALLLAEQCGIAFQLTNVIRDVREDAENDRIYLPQEDLREFGVGSVPDAITPQWRDLLAFEASRAREYYRLAQPLAGMVDPSCRASLRALIGIYSELLERIEAAGYDVFRARIRVPTATKVLILLRSLIGFRNRILTRAAR